MHANIKSPNSNAYISSSFCGKHLTTFFLFALVSSLIKIILNTFIPSEHWIYPKQTCSCTQYVHFFPFFLYDIGFSAHFCTWYYSPQILLCFYFRYSLSLCFLRANKISFENILFMLKRITFLLACHRLFFCVFREKKSSTSFWLW